MASEPKERGVSTEAEFPDPGTIRPWPADRVERWPIERLIPYAFNPRVHSEADLDKVAAAARIGLRTIPVIVARGWSEEEKNAYRITDNQLAVRASWDPDLLRGELQALDFADFDLGLIGFEADTLETILAGLGTSGLTDPDSVPERPDQPITRLGDVWQLGQHRVGCGDSTSTSDVAPVLMGSQPLLMVTDPPYGVGYDPAWRARRGLSAGAQGKVLNDDRA